MDWAEVSSQCHGEGDDAPADREESALKGRAVCFGAISIVNAIAAGKGATAGVSLTTSAKVEMSETERTWRILVNDRPSGHVLPVEAVRQALIESRLDPRKYGGTIEIHSIIPMGVGLKSSSSTSVAVSLAALNALGKSSIDVERVLRCSAKASLKSRVSVTGAIDDAASCLLGGVNMTDNLKLRLLRSRRIGKRLGVLIKIPNQRSRRKSMDLGKARRFQKVCESLFRMSLGGSYWEAMTLNGLVYSHLLGYPTQPALQAIEFGALGAGLSGTGPAVAAVFDPSQRKAIGGLRRLWSSDGSLVMESDANDERGRFLD